MGQSAGKRRGRRSDSTPDNFNGYSIASLAYAAMNRMDDAKAILMTAQQRKLGSIVIHEQLGTIALAEGDSATLAKEEPSQRPRRKGSMICSSAMPISQGPVAKSGVRKNSTNRPTRKPKPLGLGDSIVNNSVQVALVTVMAGEKPSAIAEAGAVFKKSQAPSILRALPTFTLVPGEDAQAEKLVARAASERPDDQNIQSSSRQRFAR